MHPADKKPVKKPAKKPTKVGTTKRKDGSQQWESQAFRQDSTKSLSGVGSMAERKKRAEATGTASAAAFIKTGAMVGVAKNQASRDMKKGRKHGAGK